MSTLFSSFRNRSAAKAVAALAILLLIAYAVWEGYWYTKVGLGFVKWHTHLMVYVYPGLFFFIAFRLIKSPSVLIKNFFLASFSILLSLFVAESFLLMSGTYAGYTERRLGNYCSPHTTEKHNYYFTWPVGRPHLLVAPEYRYARPTNSLGFGDVEWSKPKRPGEVRILALGDSFTEGDGAPYDSSYVSLLRAGLDTLPYPISVMNAGSCGSDPFYNYVNLRDRLVAYQPDIIVQSLGSGDMSTDILGRGGMERFLPDGTVRYLPGPWWEPVYAMSYISRAFFRAAGYDLLLRKGPITAAESQRINESAAQLFSMYSTLCKEHNIKLVITLHPGRGETEENKYSYDLSPLLQRLAADSSIHIADLLPCYRRYIAAQHSAPTDYFWKQDGHHNPRGYKMMADATLQAILPLMHDTIAK